MSTVSYPSTYFHSSSDTEMEMPMFEVHTPKSRSNDISRAPMRKAEKRMSLRITDDFCRSLKLQKIDTVDNLTASLESINTPKGGKKIRMSTNAPKRLSRPLDEEPFLPTCFFEKITGVECSPNSTTPETPRRISVPRRSIVEPFRRYSN